MVPGSSRYTREALFGLAELNECVHAAYTDDAGSEYRAFVVLEPPGAASDEVWQKLASVWQETELEGKPILWRKVPYSGLVGVIRSDGEIVGVADAADDSQLRERLGMIVGR
jgi:hypothetical protein